MNICFCKVITLSSKVAGCLQIDKSSLLFNIFFFFLLLLYTFLFAYNMSDVCANGDHGDIYVSTTKVTKTHRLFDRLQELREFYIKEFSQEPQFFVRVPGR